jgi:hypothetical protein
MNNPNFSNYSISVETLIKSNDYRSVLVGLMAASGLDSASLLNLLVFKKAIPPHILLYCQQLHYQNQPLQQRLTLTDSQLVLNAISSLRKNNQAIDFSHCLTGEEINFAVAEFTADMLISVDLPGDLDLVRQYEDLLPLLFTQRDLQTQSSTNTASEKPNRRGNLQESLSQLTFAIDNLTDILSVNKSIPTNRANSLGSPALSYLSDDLPTSNSYSQKNNQQNISSPPKTKTTTSKPDHYSPEHSEELRAKINAAIDIIEAHNNEPGRNQIDKWMINKAILRRLAKSGQYAVNEVFAERSLEINEHNKLHDLTHKRKPKEKDYLYLLDLVEQNIDKD